MKRYDYSRPGAYFITICMKDRECLFGEITDGACRGRFETCPYKPAPTKPNVYGKIVEHCWYELPDHYSNVQLDVFVVMPNHVHGIIILTNNVGAGFKPAPTHGLAEIVRAFKSFSSRKINEIRNTPGINFWQRNYYEHIIRNEDELNRIREYIQTNPMRWHLDRENLLRTGNDELEERIFPHMKNKNAHP